MDLYLEPDLTKKEERYKKKIQELIEYCHYCQPYDGGECVWIFGIRTSIEDLFDVNSIPEKSWKNILSYLYCPSCGFSDFELGFDVGLMTNFDQEVNQHMKQVDRLYGKEVSSFEALIEQYPFLAFQHKFGKRIFKELELGTLPIVNTKGKFYRARNVTSAEVLSMEKMSSPPIGIPLEGRFNHAGQSHLYLANDKVGAIKEVVSNEKSILVWYQEFEIENEIENILDLSFDWLYLTPSTSALLLSLKIHDTIDRSDRNKEFWRPDYYITRFIMDCAKKVGYNGIKYNSTKENAEYNLVLFYPEKLNLKAVGDPRIEIFINKKDIDDLNDDFY